MILNGEVILKVVVDNYTDYIEIKSNWPQDAFKNGLRVEVLPHQSLY